MKYYYQSLLILLLSVGSLFAQTFKIKGRIIDELSKKPMPYVSISVFNSDSLISGVLTDDQGLFDLRVSRSFSSLKIQYMGYETWEKTFYRPISMINDLGDIYMKPSAVMLEAAEVKAEKVTLEMNLDRKVFNVEKNIQTTGGTAQDVLQNIPTLSVDNEGKASVRNNQVGIYIDGQPTTLELDQIPADQIEQVEIITNPSARYDASSKNGIVNIRMKKNKKAGISGTISSGIGTNKFLTNSVNINLGVKKWNFFMGYNQNTHSNPTRGFTDRTTLQNGLIQQYFNQDSENLFKRASQMARGGFEYSFSNKSTLTFTGTYSTRLFKVDEEQTYYFIDPQFIPVLNGNRSIASESNLKNYSMQPVWRLEKGNHEWSTDILLNYNKGQNLSSFTSFDYDGQQILLPNNPFLQNNQGNSESKNIIGTIDYKNKKSDTTYYEAGIRIKEEVKNQDFISQVYDYSSSNYMTEDELSIDYQFNDRVYAGYYNYISKYKSLSYQWGIRYEQSNFKGLSHIGDIPISYNYPSSINDIYKALFPSIFLSKKIQKSEFQFNASRKITRPDFMQITPVILFSDRQNLRIGNPALRPEFINTLEFNHQIFKGSFHFLSSAYFKHTEDPISVFLSPWGLDSTVLLNSFINADYSLNYGLEETVKWSYTKLFEWVINMNVFNNQLFNQQMSTQGWSWSGKLNTTFRPSKTWVFQMSGSYRSPQVLLQGQRLDKYFIDLSLRKSFFDQSLTFTASVVDLFNTNVDRYRYKTDFFEQEAARRRDVRYYKMVVQYNFGQRKSVKSSQKPKMVKPERESEEGF